METRLTLRRMQNPLRGLMHGVAALASMVGLGILLIRSSGHPGALLGSLIFGASLVAMYTVSSLYHSVPWGDLWKRRLRRVDHSMIYLVVAGTFTPIAVASLEGTTLVMGLTVVWGLAVTGIVLKTFLREIRTGLSATLQMAMGWLAVVWLPKIHAELGLAAVALIALGGVCYTLGVVVLAARRPLRKGRAFSYHELFHVLVISGSVFHFAAVSVYAIPAAV